MILESKKTILGYRCPNCGGGVLGLCGDFTLAGGRLLKIICPCGESHVSVQNTQDGKLRLTVPCLLCATDHHYLVSPAVFYGRDLFRLNCAYTNLDIAFVGQEAAVRAALDENEVELNRLFAEAGLSTLSELRAEKERRAGEDLLPDAQVLDVIRFLIRDLEDEGKIDCPCHNGEYEIELLEGGVRVFCRNCGAEHLFPTGSVSAAQDFLACDHLRLEMPPEDK